MLLDQCLFELSCKHTHTHTHTHTHAHTHTHTVAHKYSKKCNYNDTVWSRVSIVYGAEEKGWSHRVNISPYCVL